MWSRRRTEITRKAAELSAAFQQVNGRPPTPAERNDLYQSATLATREAKHAPPSRNEQRERWRSEADQLLGRGGVYRMLRTVFSQRPVPAPVLDRAWFVRSTEVVLAEVEQHRGQWQEHHVPAEVQGHARAAGVPIEHLDATVEQLIAMTLGRLDALLAGESEAVLAWLRRFQHAAPDTIGDPSLIRAAREGAAADPDGTWLVEHLHDEARRPLPDDHKADVLRYRLDGWINPTWETVEPSPIHDPLRDDHRPSRPERGIPR